MAGGAECLASAEALRPLFMYPISSFRFFLRHCLYALAFFALVCIAAEAIVPGSIAPFLDPLPFSILALGLLAVDGAYGAGKQE